MSKLKIAAIVLASILVVALGYVAFKYFSKAAVEIVQPIDAIPDNNAFILMLNSISELQNYLKSNSNFLGQIMLGTEKDSSMASLQSLFQEASKDEDLNEIISNSNLYVSAHLMSTDNFKYLYTIPYSEDFDGKSLFKFLEKKGSFTISKFQDITVNNFTFNSNNLKLYFVVNKGIISITNSKFLIEKVVFNLKNIHKISTTPAMAKLIKMAGKDDPNLYVNYKYFYRYLASLAPNYRQEIDCLSNLSHRAEMDIKVSGNYILFSGYSIETDSIPTFLKLLDGQQPQHINIINIAPYNTMFLYYTAVENYSEFYNKSKEFYTETQKSRITEMEEKYKIDVKENVLSWINKEVAMCVTKSEWNLDKENSFAIIAATDLKEANQQLESISIKSNSRDTSVYREYTIRHINIPYFIPNIFGKMYENLINTYYTQVGNNIVFANSGAALYPFIDSYLIGRTLKEDEKFNEFAKNISDNANIFIFSNFTQYNSYFSKYLKTNLDSNMKIFGLNFNKIGCIGIEFSAGENGTYTSIVLNSGNINATNNASEKWQTALDAEVFGNPLPIINIQNNLEELLVFDNQKNLYKIDNSGKIIWKIPLIEAPVSDIYVLDFYKNGRNEYAFNTANYIYIIDINGNRVEDYPHKLKHSATGKMALMDYDGTKDYRFVIPLKDGKLHNIMLNGQETTGWAKPDFSSRYLTPVQHIRLNTKDFLLFSDTLGNVIFASRRGEVRMEAKLSFTNNCKTKYYIKGTGTEEKLITTDLLGRIVEISADGGVTKTFFADFSTKHDFIYSDFDMDGNSDYIYLDKNVLTVFSEDKTVIYQHRLAGVQIDKMVAINYKTEDNSKLILHNKTDNSLILVGVAGKALTNSEFKSTINYQIGEATKSDFLRLITINNRVVSNFLIK